MNLNPIHLKEAAKLSEKMGPLQIVQATKPLTIILILQFNRREKAQRPNPLMFI